MASSKASSYTDALREYLHGEEWRENVDIFIRSNCAQFRSSVPDDDSQSHKHYSLWKTFQEIVESILEVALMSIGGSMQSLEKALDDVARTKGRGPRDESVQDIADRLLCCTDYHSFIEMMISAAQEHMDSSYSSHSARLHSVVSVPAHPRTAAANRYTASQYEDKAHNGNTPSHANEHANHRETLLLMGFPAALVDSVLPDGSASEDASLEQLVLLLSEMTSSLGSESNEYKADAKTVSSSQYSRGHLHGQTPTHSTANGRTADIKTSPSPMSPSHQQARLPHLEDFAAAMKVADASSMVAKFAIARSVVDSFAHNTCDVNEGGAALLLLQWGSEMMQLLAQVETAYIQGISFDKSVAQDSTSSREIKSLTQWYDELEILRRRYDDLEGGGGLVSDSELKRMAELDALAAMGTEDEALMHSMITRHDKVRQELNMLHSRCGALLSPGSGISRATLEELYLYLKDKVASGAELGSLSEELHEHVYSLVSDGGKAGDCISVLLDMHVLEDEQYILRQRINAMLSPGGGDRVSPEDDFFSAGAKEGSRSASSPRAASMAGDMSIAEDKDSTSSAHVGQDGTKSTPSPSRRPPRRFDHREILDNAERGDPEDVVAAALMSRHKESVARLKNDLDAEKDRRLNELERRLHRRKMLRDRELSDARAAGMDPKQLASLEASLLAAEQEIQQELTQTVVDYDATKASLVSGFKRRCIYEIKACKDKGGPLSPEEEMEAQRAAAEAIRKRHERDSANLLASLADQKSKQRAKLLAQLQGKLSTGDDSEGRQSALSDAEVRAELSELDEIYSQQETQAIHSAQRQVLLQLAGININSSLLEPSASSNKEGDDDDLYAALGSPRSSAIDKASAMREWLVGVEGLRNAYLNTASELQTRLVGAFRSDGNAEGAEEEEQDLETHRRSLAVYMNKVVVNSFASQIAPPAAMLQYSAAGGEDELGLERVRKALLVEFEKSQGEYQTALQRAKDSSAALLKKRKMAWGDGGNGRKNGAGTGGGEGDVEKASMGMDVLGSFVSNPNPIPADPFGSRSMAYSSGKRGELSTIAQKAKRAGEYSKRLATEAEMDAKADQQISGQVLKQHSEKEAALLRGLAEDMAIKKAMLQNRLKKRQQAKPDISQTSGPLADCKSDGSGEGDDDEEIKRLEGNIASLASEMATIGTSSDRVGHVQQQLQHRERMEQEARRISDSFSAEQQRHDLMMKMQHARQRQMLQRKLLERKGVGSADASLSNCLLPAAALAAGAITPAKHPAFRGLDSSMSFNPGSKETDDGIGNRGMSTMHLARK